MDGNDLKYDDEKVSSKTFHNFFPKNATPKSQQNFILNCILLNYLLSQQNRRPTFKA
jgi:hypothetical protein